MTAEVNHTYIYSCQVTRGQVTREQVTREQVTRGQVTTAGTHQSDTTQADYKQPIRASSRPLVARPGTAAAVWEV